MQFYVLKDTVMRTAIVGAMLLILAACATREERYVPTKGKDRSPDRYQEDYVH